MRDRECMDAESLRALLQSIRRVLPHINQSQLKRDGHLQNMMGLHNWMACLQQHVDLQRQPEAMSLENRKYAIATLISAFVAGQLLQNDSTLREACLWCVRSCLSPKVADEQT